VSTLVSSRHRTIEAGMSDYLPKPFNPKQLFETIKKNCDFDSFVDQEVSNSGIAQLDTTDTVDTVTGLDRDYLNEVIGDDHDYAIDIFDTFLLVTPPSLIEVKEHFRNQSFGEMGLIIHKIKLTFKMVGIPNASKHLGLLEAACKSKDSKNINKLYSDFLIHLDDYYHLVRSELELLEHKLKINAK